jgi:Flp pilus assembly protein TadG
VARRSSRIRRATTTEEQGQATVELALLLPVVVMIIWACLEGILMARDQVLLSHAAREAARAYSTSQSVETARQAAQQRSGFGTDLVLTVTNEPSGIARVHVSLNQASRRTLIGTFTNDLIFTADVAIAVETDSGS